MSREVRQITLPAHLQPKQGRPFFIPGASSAVPLSSAVAINRGLGDVDGGSSGLSRPSVAAHLAAGGGVEASQVVARPLLCLAMILKNEAACIGATLETVAPFIDRWCILDTGSSDDTIARVQQALAGVQGVLHPHIPFINFSATRNYGLELARAPETDAEFVLWMDADDELLHGDALRNALEAARTSAMEAFTLRVWMNDIKFCSTRVFRSSARWRFEGVVHEVLVSPRGSYVPQLLETPVIKHFNTAATLSRSAIRWERDVGLLTAELKTNPTDTRAAFYLGLTCMWLHRHEEAERWLNYRLSLGGWWEEQFECFLNLAEASKRQVKPWAVTLELYLAAIEIGPARAPEALFHIASHYYEKRQLALTYLFASKGFRVPRPTTAVLFVFEEVYTWRLADLVGASAIALGELEIGEAAVRTCLDLFPTHPDLHGNLEMYTKAAAEKIK